MLYFWTAPPKDGTQIAKGSNVDAGDEQPLQIWAVSQKRQQCDMQYLSEIRIEGEVFESSSIESLGKKVVRGTARCVTVDQNTKEIIRPDNYGATDEGQLLDSAQGCPPQDILVAGDGYADKSRMVSYGVSKQVRAEIRSDDFEPSQTAKGAVYWEGLDEERVDRAHVVGGSLETMSDLRRVLEERDSAWVLEEDVSPELGSKGGVPARAHEHATGEVALGQ
ncbi:hypothetical protein BGZ58_010363 [Dissophora ornata]|nr:hypothetical protein BGZ58_010363 [Dissophora ornata]